MENAAPTDRAPQRSAPRGEHLASRRGGQTTAGAWKLLCAVVRAERLAHPDLELGDLAERVKAVAARAGLVYDGPLVRKAIDACAVAAKRQAGELRPRAAHRAKPAVAASEAERQALLRRALGPLGWYGSAR